MNDIVIKVLWDGQTRRIQYGQCATVGYKQLRQVVETLYGRPLDGNLTYQKEPNHTALTIASDEEFARAIQQTVASSDKRRILRLQVMRTQTSESSSLAETVLPSDASTVCEKAPSCAHSDTSVGEMAYKDLSEKLNTISNKIDQLTLSKSETPKSRFDNLLRKLEQTPDDQPLEQLRILAEIAAQIHKTSSSAESEALKNNIADTMAARAAATTAAAAAAVAPRAPSPKPSTRQRKFMCDACGDISSNLRFRCRQCPDFDLCKNCYHSASQRSRHPITHRFDYVNSELQVIEVAQHRHRAYCDICLKVIHGYRYKCRVCSDYDLCDACLPLASSSHGSHEFRLIAHPSQAVQRTTTTTASASTSTSRTTSQTSEKPVHSRVICDHCERTIKGVRYKCGNCPDFDLCETCEASKYNRHPQHHVMIKIEQPLPHRAPTHQPLLPNLYDRHVAGLCLRLHVDKSTSTLTTLVDEPKTTAPPPPPPPQPKIESRSTQTTPPSEETKSVQTVAEEEKKVDNAALTPPPPLDAKCVRSFSIEDGQLVQPDTVLVKSWLVTNTGSETWPDGTVLLHIGGDFKSEDTSPITVPTLAPGANVVLSVRVRTPKEGGMKAAYWRLTTSTGRRFGDRFWCELEVAAPKPMPAPMLMSTPMSMPVPVVTMPTPMPMPAPVAMSMPIPTITRTLPLASDPKASPTPVMPIPTLDILSESESEEYASATEAKSEAESASESEAETEPAQTAKVDNHSAVAVEATSTSETTPAVETHSHPAVPDATSTPEADHLSVPNMTASTIPADDVSRTRISGSCTILYPTLDVHAATPSSVSSPMMSRSNTELGYSTTQSEDDASTVLSSASHPYFGTDREDQPATRPSAYYPASDEFTSELSEYEDSVADSEDIGHLHVRSPATPSLGIQIVSYDDSDSDDFASDFSVLDDANDEDSDF